MTAATLSAVGVGAVGSDDNAETESSSGSTRRQPDYYVGANGIPRLVGGRAAVTTTLATRTSLRSGAVDQQKQRRKMNQCGTGTSSGGGFSVVATDPVKLNKCLYNLTVRNRNGSKAESDIAIRSPCSHKSKSSTSGSDNNNNSNLTGTVSSASSPSTMVITTGLGNNRRNSVTSYRGSSSSSSSIPRSITHCVHLGRNANKSGTTTTVTGSSSRISNGISSSSSSSAGRSHSTTTLLSDRQRRNAATSDSNRREDDGECGNNGLMRQCRFTVAVRRPPPTSASTDNRLNYQRKYDRSIFGYNRLDQIVLPPLQI